MPPRHTPAFSAPDPSALPRIHRAWRDELITRARHGADPALLLAVPGAVLDTASVPAAAHQTADGTWVISLEAALDALGAGAPPVHAQAAGR